MRWGKVIILTEGVKQPLIAAWSMERLVHERPVSLGLALGRSTAYTYSSALNSCLIFCNLHRLSADPTINRFSLYVRSMAAHISPRSVDNYFSETCSQHLILTYV
ncbi:hypothetical protein K503DRAFT_817758 [Rhizopogon vinicolor AM-OR11-026]|uniref:Uncharacterized protein n=1 Tax=Rhizopogon vinicolor AM-OR11-026 TaxID=1314800 RepID=A0A1B7N0I9_9AGAM|nr:hypothetical protein K503DRAFT_817758 [Rhizopogon vinicolor AM-OR11-026]